MPHPIEPCPCGSLKLYKDCCGKGKEQRVNVRRNRVSRASILERTNRAALASTSAAVRSVHPIAQAKAPFLARPRYSKRVPQDICVDPKGLAQALERENF